MASTSFKLKFKQSIVMIELVIACFIGILIGTTTGMIPGIHVNTAGAILFASSSFLLTVVSPEFLCVLMVSMSIAHALIEFVPSMEAAPKDEKDLKKLKKMIDILEDNDDVQKVHHNCSVDLESIEL